MVYTNTVYLFSFSLLGLVCLVILQVLQIAYRKGIRDVPGPWVAKFSILYRLSLIIKGRAPEEYGKLHGKYGNVVRVGPNQVSINDPAAIPQIYGISSKFGKVSTPRRICVGRQMTNAQVGVLQRLPTIL